VGLLAGASLVAVLFGVALAAKERDNRFCIACHLHEEKFTRFLAPTSRDLAGVHHVKKAVRCIDCHGGADLSRHLAIWAVAGFDTLKFLAGYYEEPDHMRLPLRDPDCRQCHTPILKSAPVALTPEQEEALEGRTGDSYHAMRDHNTVKISCVGCHPSHTIDGEARFQFLARPRLLPLCRDCHKSMGEEVGYTLREVGAPKGETRP
jgi:hypothetical protein